MSPERVFSEVVVVGAGPVGLFLSLCLRRMDIACLTLERNTERSSHSRAIGIHRSVPVAPVS